MLLYSLKLVGSQPWLIAAFIIDIWTRFDIICLVWTLDNVVMNPDPDNIWSPRFTHDSQHTTQGDGWKMFLVQASLLKQQWDDHVMTRCNFIMSSSAPNWITMIRIFCAAAILFATFSVSSLQVRIHYDHSWPCSGAKIWIENTDCNIKMFQQQDFVISRPALCRKHWQGEWKWTKAHQQHRFAN